MRCLGGTGVIRMVTEHNANGNNMAAGDVDGGVVVNKTKQTPSPAKRLTLFTSEQIVD